MRVAAAGCLSLAPAIGFGAGFCVSRVFGVDPFPGWMPWVIVWLWLGLLAGLGAALLLRLAVREASSRRESIAFFVGALIGAINFVFGVAFAVFPYLLREMY